MLSDFNVVNEIREANKRIGPYIRKTYLEKAPVLSSEYNSQVYFKLENWQHTGSFNR